MASNEEWYKALVEQNKARFSRELDAADARRGQHNASALGQVKHNYTIAQHELTSNAPRNSTSTPKPKKEEKASSALVKKEELSTDSDRRAGVQPSHTQSRSTLQAQPSKTDRYHSNELTTQVTSSSPSATTLPHNQLISKNVAVKIETPSLGNPDGVASSTSQKQNKTRRFPEVTYRGTARPGNLSTPFSQATHLDVRTRLQQSTSAEVVSGTSSAPLAATNETMSSQFQSRTPSTGPPPKKARQSMSASAETAPVETSTNIENTLSSAGQPQVKSNKIVRPFAPPKYVRPANAPARATTSTRTVLPAAAKDLYPGVTSREVQNVDSHHKYRLLRAAKDFQDYRTASETHSGNLEELEDKVINTLGELQFFPHVTLPLLRAARFFEETRGFNLLLLPSINSHFQADAKALQYKWLQHDFDPNLLRGVDYIVRTTNGKSRRNPKLSSASTIPYYEGHGDLHNGQWWPMQICTKRDGAHRELEAGISGDTKNGADSIVLSDGGYSDEDNGTNLIYCGTSGKDGEMTHGTKMLLISHHANKTIRVLRSAKLKSRYAPDSGIRYDGLYKIVAFTIVDEDTAMHQFRLQRVEGQDPIRFEGKSVRPNAHERREWEKTRNLLDKKGD